jgi:hypothetical protein
MQGVGAVLEALLARIEGASEEAAVVKKIMAVMVVRVAIVTAVAIREVVARVVPQA